MLLVIDNYDSFTYNLVQYLGELGAGRCAWCATTRSPSTTSPRLRPTHLVISPGPCTPNEAGISLETITPLRRQDPDPGRLPGPPVHRAGFRRQGGARRAQVMHGKTSMIAHDGKGVFAGLPNPFEATRYHSLVVERASLPDCLEITATTDDGQATGRRSWGCVTRPCAVEGVQFHPESFLTRGQGPAAEFLGAERDDHDAHSPPRKRSARVPWTSRSTNARVRHQEAIARVVDRQDLSADEMALVVGEIMDAQATPAQIGGLLTALRMQGRNRGRSGGRRARHARPHDAACCSMCRWWWTPAARAETARGR